VLIAAHLVQWCFYAALIIQPILGLFIAWSRGDTVTAFGVVTLPVPWDISDAARERLMTAYIATAAVLVCLVLVHLAAVVFNHWRRGGPVLERMLPAAPPDHLVNRVPVVVQLLAALAIFKIVFPLAPTTAPLLPHTQSPA
jgi:cytochrome b561